MEISILPRNEELLQLYALIFSDRYLDTFFQRDTLKLWIKEDNYIALGILKNNSMNHFDENLLPVSKDINEKLPKIIEDIKNFFSGEPEIKDDVSKICCSSCNILGRIVTTRKGTKVFCNECSDIDCTHINSLTWNRHCGLPADYLSLNARKKSTSIRQRIKDICPLESLMVVKQNPEKYTVEIVTLITLKEYRGNGNATTLIENLKTLQTFENYRISILTANLESPELFGKFNIYTTITIILYNIISYHTNIYQMYL
jgi:hypothetical protein